MLIKWFGQKPQLISKQLKDESINFLRIEIGGIETGEVEEYEEEGDLVKIPITRTGVAIEFETSPSEETLEIIDALIPLCIRERQKGIITKIAKNVTLEYPNPNKQAYKFSQLYGLTQQQLANYIDNNVTNQAQAKEFIKKLSAVVLWLVKQTKLDE